MEEWIKPETRPEELVEAAMTEMVFEKVDNETASTNANAQMRIEY